MYELINMELQYDSDLISLFDKVRLINSLLELDDYYYSKLGSIIMEVGYHFLSRQIDGNVVIEISSGATEHNELVLRFSFPIQKNSAYNEKILSNLYQFIEYFHGRHEVKIGNDIVELYLDFGRFKSSVILDELSIEQFKKELADSEMKQFSTKSKEDLLLDLKYRSSKLKEMTDYVEMVERKSQEISSLNSMLSDKNLELQSSMEKVRQADRTKSQFLANMSHELRTPLNSIIGFTQLIADGLAGDVNEEQSEVMGDILNSANHLLNLINQILDISKIEAGMMEIKPRSLDLIPVVNNVQNQLHPLLQSKNLNFVTDMFSEEVQIFSDETRLKQILINLLSNAIKFSPSGSDLIVNATDLGQFVQISVQDFGLGIKEEDQKSVFDEFKQVDDSHTREYQGTGLGLSLCKRLTELHGGRIWVKSKLGEGSTFFFTMPKEEIL